MTLFEFHEQSTWLGIDLYRTTTHNRDEQNCTDEFQIHNLANSLSYDYQVVYLYIYIYNITVLLIFRIKFLVQISYPRLDNNAGQHVIEI